MLAPMTALSIAGSMILGDRQKHLGRCPRKVGIYRWESTVALLEESKDNPLVRLFARGKFPIHKDYLVRREMRNANVAGCLPRVPNIVFGAQVYRSGLMSWLLVVLLPNRSRFPFGQRPCTPF